MTEQEAGSTRKIPVDLSISWLQVDVITILYLLNEYTRLTCALSLPIIPTNRDIGSAPKALA